MVIGVLQVEIHIPTSHTLKDKRSVVKSLKDQIHGRFNVAVAEVDADEKWQRATLGMSTVGEGRTYVQEVLKQVSEWLRTTHLVDVMRIDEEYV